MGEREKDGHRRLQEHNFIQIGDDKSLHEKKEKKENSDMKRNVLSLVHLPYFPSLHSISHFSGFQKLSPLIAICWATSPVDY